MEGTQQDPSYTSVAKLGGGCGDHMFPGTFQVGGCCALRAALRQEWGTTACLEVNRLACRSLHVPQPCSAATDPLKTTHTTLPIPGTKQAQRGVWNSVALRVRLNSPGKADGVAGLGVNGSYREYHHMVWRLGADTRISQVRAHSRGVACACWQVCQQLLGGSQAVVAAVVQALGCLATMCSPGPPTSFRLPAAAWRCHLESRLG